MRSVERRAERVPPGDRASDDRRQRAGRKASRRAWRATLYRVHEEPDPQRVERLARRWPRSACRRPDERAALAVAGGRAGRPHLAGSRTTAIRRSRRRAFASLILRSLKQASIRPQHRSRRAALAAYCHFTSPIRRYPDLVCHRALLSAVGGGEREPAGPEGSRSSSVDLRTRARGDEDRARRRRRGEMLRLSNRCSSRSGPEQGLHGRDHRSHLRGRVRRVRRRIRGDERAGDPAFEGMLPVRLLGEPGAGPRGAPAALRRSPLRRTARRARVVGAERAGHDPSRRAHGRDASPGRPA